MTKIESNYWYLLKSEKWRHKFGHTGCFFIGTDIIRKLHLKSPPPLNLKCFCLLYTIKPDTNSPLNPSRCLWRFRTIMIVFMHIWIRMVKAKQKRWFYFFFFMPICMILIETFHPHLLGVFLRRRGLKFLLHRPERL